VVSQNLLQRKQGRGWMSTGRKPYRVKFISKLKMEVCASNIVKIHMDYRKVPCAEVGEGSNTYFRFMNLQYINGSISK